MSKKISVVISSYNMAHLIEETLVSCQGQAYPDIEIIVYDDCSTDFTQQMFKFHDPRVKYIRGERNLGVGDGFNEAMKHATGEYLVLMCADDLFLSRYVLSDIAKIFDECPTIGHVSRYYYQFVHGYNGPVRAWRSQNPIIQANNPSGLAFRKSALLDPRYLGCYHKCSNHMFIETSYLVSQVLKAGWHHGFLYYDAIGARVHKSTSTQGGYWLKRCVSSPVQDWVSIGGKEILKDYCSFIQIKNGFNVPFLLKEIWLFIKLRPLNLLAPGFYFYALVALLTPRAILQHIPAFYRHRISRHFTQEIKRQ